MLVQAVMQLFEIHEVEQRTLIERDCRWSVTSLLKKMLRPTVVAILVVTERLQSWSCEERRGIAICTGDVVHTSVDTLFLLAHTEHVAHYMRS